MAAEVVIIVDKERKHTGVQLREVQDIVRNVNMVTVAYVTTPVKSWSTMKEFFSEYNTSMADYLFDELEKERQAAEFNRNRAKLSLALSDKLKAENDQLKIRVEYLAEKCK